MDPFSWTLLFAKVFLLYYFLLGASLVAQTVKRLSAMRVTWIRSLGQEDPLEEETATHFSKYSCVENSMDGGAW